ncbi:MAG: hypothetical protein H7Y20_07715, partial [Bryobacteraceae bacterium]|nr:hypothetical protein [Bryobacteraceae bacterium]
MSDRFRNLHCVVTGGARGIGAAVVHELRVEGGTVYVADILAGSCEDSCDVSKPDEVRQ